MTEPTDSNHAPAAGLAAGPALDRRVLLQATGVVAAAGLVAACSSSSQTAPVEGGAGTGTAALVPVADVPVGGGVIIEEPAIVVTQPGQGDLKAFSAICPHQGCLVSEVVDQEIVCPCHGSTFSIVDGAVISGPAEVGLAPKAISVQDGSVTLA